MNDTLPGLIDPTFARALYYRFLARAFSYPKAGALQALRDDLPPAETAAAWSSEAVSAALEEIRRQLAEQTDASLESAHLAVFGHTISDKWPPHETRFGSSHPFQETQDMADIAAFYEAFGLKVRAGTGERVDHIALELEFGHFLAVKELVAREKEDGEGAAVTLDAAKKFFKDHVGRWGPVFGEILTQKAPIPWTQALGTLLTAVLRADCGLLGVTPGNVSAEPIPLPPEPVEEEEAEE
ncbi:MAG: molecular chaperone TorD family protein [Planctomycetes bacterium]|nr:molecular chaperone TorD family protein [Planctomycetota bacterium]